MPGQYADFNPRVWKDRQLRIKTLVETSGVRMALESASFWD
jgi:hypothetical protein